MPFVIFLSEKGMAYACSVSMKITAQLRLLLIVFSTLMLLCRSRWSRAKGTKADQMDSMEKQATLKRLLEKCFKFWKSGAASLIFGKVLLVTPNGLSYIMRCPTSWGVSKSLRLSWGQSLDCSTLTTSSKGCIACILPKPRLPSVDSLAIVAKTTAFLVPSLWWDWVVVSMAPLFLVTSI